MRWMHEIVIPEVNYCWEKIADYLGYTNSKKKEIKKRQHTDPRDCCVELLEDWLNSNRGPSPKTWKTLVSVLEQITELSSSVERIKQKLMEEGLYEC